MIVRIMKDGDLNRSAAVHKATFSRQQHSYEWLRCNLNAFPRFMCYVVESQNGILGYIIWVQKSGFRPEAVLELEQIAVLPESQGKGLGRRLILESLRLVKEQLAVKDSVLKHVVVSTRADNYAQKLYENSLGAEVEATLSNLYSADEVLMIARDVGSRI